MLEAQKVKVTPPTWKLRRNKLVVFGFGYLPPGSEAPPFARPRGCRSRTCWLRLCRRSGRWTMSSRAANSAWVGATCWIIRSWGRSRARSGESFIWCTVCIIWRRFDGCVTVERQNECQR